MAQLLLTPKMSITKSIKLFSVIFVIAFFGLLVWHNPASAETTHSGWQDSFDENDPGTSFSTGMIGLDSGYVLTEGQVGFSVTSHGTETWALCFYNQTTNYCIGGNGTGGSGSIDPANYNLGYYAVQGYGSYSCNIGVTPSCYHPSLPQGITSYGVDLTGVRASVDEFSFSDSSNVDSIDKGNPEHFTVYWTTDLATDFAYPSVDLSGPISCNPSGNLNQGGDNESGILECDTNGTGDAHLTLTANGPGDTSDSKTITVHISSSPGAHNPPGNFTLLSADAYCSSNGNATTVDLDWSGASGADYYNVHSNFGIPGGNNITGTAFSYGERKGTTLFYYIEAVNAYGHTDSNEINGVEACPRPGVTMSANPTSVDYNTASTLSYSSHDAYICNISGGSLNQSITANTSGSISTGNLTSSTIFNFTCSDPDGGYADTKLVEVGADGPPSPQDPYCTNATPDNDTVYSNALTRRTYANGVGNSTAVYFERIESGVATAWYSGSVLSGSTWYYDIPVSGTLVVGSVTVRVHVYNAASGNVLCDSANFTVATEPPAGSPTCTSATPDNDTINNSQPTRRTYANGVANATSLYFGTWTDTGGQDDLIFHSGSVLSGNTWYSDIPMSSHSGTGGVNVHVYMSNASVSNVWCDSANFTVSAPPGISFNITYTPQVLSAPTAVSVDNSTCERLTTSWAYTTSGIENGFYVYRSTDGSAWGSPISGLLATNVRSYQDTPPQINTRYYYRVSTHRTAAIDPQEVYSESDDAMNLSCTANLTISKTLDKINGAPYSGSTEINDGDTLTYKILVINYGPSNATVNLICEDSSANLQNISNLSVSGSGSNNGGISQGNATCTSAGYSGLRLNVSGTKDLVNNWIITFDEVFNATSSDPQETINSCSNLNYTDSTSHWAAACSNRILVNTGTPQVPTFREVAP